MSSAGRAIGWEFRRRHRQALIALAAYVAVFAAIKVLILGSAIPSSWIRQMAWRGGSSRW